MRTTDQVIKDALKSEISDILSSFPYDRVARFHNIYDAMGGFDNLSIDNLKSALALCQRTVREDEAKYGRPAARDIVEIASGRTPACEPVEAGVGG